MTYSHIIYQPYSLETYTMNVNNKVLYSSLMLLCSNIAPIWVIPHYIGLHETYSLYSSLQLKQSSIEQKIFGVKYYMHRFAIKLIACLISVSIKYISCKRNSFLHSSPQFKQSTIEQKFYSGKCYMHRSSSSLVQSAQLN